MTGYYRREPAHIVCARVAHDRTAGQTARSHKGYVADACKSLARGIRVLPESPGACRAFETADNSSRTVLYANGPGQQTSRRGAQMQAQVPEATTLRRVNGRLTAHLRPDPTTRWSGRRAEGVFVPKASAHAFARCLMCKYCIGPEGPGRLLHPPRDLPL